MLYSTFSGIAIFHNTLICVVLKSSKTSWNLQRCLTYSLPNGNDWRFISTQLNKHLPKWRNCVAMSLGFEEVLSKSSVINSSLSIEEESSYIQEQVSQVLGQTKLAYDYKRQINEDSEDEVNLFLCKQDTLNTQLSNNGINIDVVGWMLTDLYILSQELLTKANLTAHYFVDISQKRILVVSCNARLESASFELDSDNLAQQIQALCLADITSMLLYGDEANIALFKNQTLAVKGISFIDACSLMPVEHNGSFSSLYPALACALGAMYWSESI